MAKGQMSKIRRTICNMAVEWRDICNSLSRDCQSSGTILAKLKKNKHSMVMFFFQPACTKKLLNPIFYSPYKTVWRTLITSYYKELMDSLTK